MFSPNVTRCLTILQRAFCSVGAEFYNLQTTYEPSGIVRERVFCYELYHQARLLMQQGELSLNGEIDKRGHKDFAKQDRKNPDFVFHIPGNHEGNTVVVEVKGALRSKNSINKDFRTLTTFIQNYNYACGVFLLYNYTMDEFIEYIGNKLDHLKEMSTSDSIVLMCKPSAHGLCQSRTFNEI